MRSPNGLVTSLGVPFRHHPVGWSNPSMRGQLTREWLDAISAFCMWAVAMGAPATTIRTRRDHLSHLGRWIGVGPWELDGPRLLAWFAAQPWAPETRRSKRTTFRVFYRWAVDAGYVKVNPALCLPRVRPARPNPRPVPDGSYLFALGVAGDRTRLMLRMAAELGMRRAEVAQAHSQDLVRDLAGWSLLVHGKGGHERLIPCPDSLAAAIRGRGPGWLFPGGDHGHLSPRWVGRLVAGVLPAGWTMHKLRHRAGTRWHEASGGDVLVVQELLGHVSPVTTRAYVKVRNDRLRETVHKASDIT